MTQSKKRGQPSIYPTFELDRGNVTNTYNSSGDCTELRLRKVTTIPTVAMTQHDNGLEKGQSII
jgi:hypothetical protein